MSTRFCKRLKESIADERKAPRDYSTLKKSAPANAKKAISRISMDEVGHGNLLRLMQLRYCEGGKR
jgi:hypothetical protein